MVGVPRSRGCTTCKRKKKGCDLARPTCTPCAKLGLDCTYQKREWTFVNEKVGIDEFHPAVKITEQSAIILQHRSFSRTALEIQVVDRFWRTFLPRDDPNTTYIGAIVKTPWKRVVQAICLQDRWVTIALQACAFMSLGRLQRNRSYVQYGRQLYGRALRETNNAIRDLKRAQTDGTLASCKLLSMYESFRLEEDGRPSTQGSDWQRHVDGICRIVELRGPQMAASDYGHDLYLDARTSAAMAGITQKKPPDFFKASAWSTVPWQKHPKTLRDGLFELLAELPSILQRQEELFAAISTSTDDESIEPVLEDGRDLLDDCIRLGSKLRAWEGDILHLARKARNEDDHDDDNNAAMTLFSISKSHGFAFFHLATQFWTANLILCGPTWLTYNKLLHHSKSNMSASTTSSLPGILIPPWMNPAPYASHIAHLASHFFSDEAGLWGSQVASLPLGAALHFYAATGGLQSAEIKMIKAALGSSPKASMVSGFLRSMAASATPEGGDPRNPDEHRKMATRWYDSSTTYSRP